MQLGLIIKELRKNRIHYYIGQLILSSRVNVMYNVRGLPVGICPWKFESNIDMVHGLNFATLALTRKVCFIKY